MTVAQFLAALRASGKTWEADELAKQITATLGFDLEKIRDQRWGDFVDSLRETLGAASRGLFTPPPVLDDSEILLGGSLPDEKALRIMKSLGPEWSAFKAQAIRGV